MRKLFFSLFLLIGLSCFAQTAQRTDSLKHAVKINLSSFVFKTISLQYEKKISHKRSITLGIKYGPESSSFLKKQVDDLFDGTKIHFYGLNTGNLAFTPGYRFYSGKGVYHGFYLSPYLRYANIKLNGPVVYDDGSTVKDGVFRANIHSVSAGVAIGASYSISHGWMIDCWIAGAHLGYEWAHLSYTPVSDLSANDMRSVTTVLKGLKVPYTSFTYDVKPSQVTVNTTGLWAGIPSLGFIVAYRF